MLIGVDVAAIARVSGAVRRRARFAERVFTDAERAYCADRPERWAARWAAKEAVRKLFSSARLRPPAMREIEVVRGRGAPRLRVGGAEAEIALTMTHDAGVAIAVVAAEEASLSPPGAALPADLRLPERPADAHKGTFGRVLVIAGARGYTGAPQLAALGAARAGAGLVTLAVPEAIYAIVASRCLEVMPSPLPDAGAGVLRVEAVPAARELLGPASALVIGPGIGRAPETAAALFELVTALPCPAVVDADALNLAAQARFDWRACGAPVIVTPHPAEMGRLAVMDTQAVQRDRTQTALRYARDAGVVVVLKGSETVVAAPDGRCSVSRHRVVALASGGTGDVLAGVIGGLVAQGLDAHAAAVAGVAVHAAAGVRVQHRRGRAGGLASDVLDELPQAQEQVRRSLEQAAATARR